MGLTPVVGVTLRDPPDECQFPTISIAFAVSVPPVWSNASTLFELTCMLQLLRTTVPPVIEASLALAALRTRTQALPLLCAATLRAEMFRTELRKRLENNLVCGWLMMTSAAPLLAV